VTGSGCTWCGISQRFAQLYLPHIDVRCLCVWTDDARQRHVQHADWLSVRSPRCEEEQYLTGRFSLQVTQTHYQRQAVLTKRSKADIERLRGLRQRLHVTDNFDLLTMTLQHLQTTLNYNHCLELIRVELIKAQHPI